MVRRLQRFFLALLLAFAANPSSGALQPGQTYSLTFRDVDGNTLSTSDGHVSIFAVVTRRSEGKARATSERVPEHCIGNPRYRYITLVNFQRGLARPLHGMTRAVIRGRLDSEAKRLQPKYDARKIKREARRDLYVVADVDGSAVSQLGFSAESNEIAVFVFNGSGKLVQRWGDVPPADALARAIVQAER